MPLCASRRWPTTFWLAALTEAATANGTRLLLPTGALVGGHSLAAMRAERWQEVSIHLPQASRQHRLRGPRHRSGRPSTARRWCSKGPVREIARLFPAQRQHHDDLRARHDRADRCIGRMVADPALEGMAVAEVFARGTDGSEIRTIKRQPMVGVSGTEMFASLLRSIRLALCPLRSGRHYLKQQSRRFTAGQADTSTLMTCGEAPPPRCLRQARPLARPLAPAGTAARQARTARPRPGRQLCCSQQ